MRTPLLLAVSAALLAGGAATAQIGNPAGMAPDARLVRPGAPAPHQPNTQDQLFVKLLGTGNMAEAELATLAASKAHSDGVKAYAERMRQAHAQGNAKLASLASAAGIAMPGELLPDQRGTRERLQGTADGAAFDLSYLQSQLVEHQKAVQVLLWEMGNGQDPELQRHAAATLPEVVEHLEAVQRLIAEHMSTAP
jgi:putative membrane protein